MPLLYCVVPPVPTALRSTVVLLLTAPAESSIRCTVSAGALPLKFSAGRKRICVVAAKISALVAATLVEMSFQVVPLVDHCHLPSAAVAALAEIAMPAKV